MLWVGSTWSIDWLTVESFRSIHGRCAHICIPTGLLITYSFWFNLKVLYFEGFTQCLAVSKIWSVEPCWIIRFSSDWSELTTITQDRQIKSDSQLGSSQSRITNFMNLNSGQLLCFESLDSVKLNSLCMCSLDIPFSLGCMDVIT